jgi:P-type Mg2+ transporter
VAVRRLSALVQLIHLFTNPLVLILLVAGAISAVLGQRTDSLIIVTIVLLGIVINFWQTHRSEQAAEALRSSVAPTATVGARRAVAGNSCENRRSRRSDSTLGRRSGAG